jgi:hypothetical protein
MKKHLKKRLERIRPDVIANIRFIYVIPVMIALLLLSSCSSVRVAADYDKNANFDNFKTFAFYKPGIDKAEINDLDKRRILRAIETELLGKGFTKSKTPDMLVSLFTKSREKINIHNHGFYGYGWGWSPWYWGGPYGSHVSRSVEGTLYIDLIDANKKELVWQGMGTGYLTKNVEKKEARIKEFVANIMERYPPGSEE